MCTPLGALNIGRAAVSSNVNANSFGKLFIQKVDGSIVGQPLYVSNVQLSNGTIHNAVYVATQHDSVYAFDADNNLGSNANPLWTVNYPKSIPDDANHCGCGTPGYTEIGIMGAPVIDPASKTLYLVSKTLESNQYYFRLHALDLASGAEKFNGPVEISATVQTSTGPIDFNAAVQLQRPALLLLNGSLYIGFGSNGCDVYDYHGWLLAYSASTLKQLGVFITTPQGSKGSIWGSGGGPAADSEGFVYVSTANGTFDYGMGGTDFGDSFVTITCSATGYISAVFAETSVAGAANVIKQYSGNKQTSPVKTPLPQPLVVSVVDVHFNPIKGAVVTFADGGKGGTFSSPTATTGTLKAATFTETVTAQ